jgi:NAD(P)-dependent dehydrogenase (short-subunit alcohol dehydrogenase family)
MLLENKVAVITGGGRGIGRSIAMHFAREGADVSLIALSFTLADEIRDQGIRVNVICPGLIQTDMVDNTTLLAKGSNVLLPDDVAGTAVFVASQLSG